MPRRPAAFADESQSDARDAADLPLYVAGAVAAIYATISHLTRDIASPPC